MAHKHSAKQRGIPFRLTFEQWWGIWEPHWQDRGQCTGCKLMSRIGDKGAYEVGNVKIATHAENQHERRELASYNRR
jgi:hypothetical protein